MRLVRGSIISSKPCSLSRAIEAIRVFLATDTGADVSVKCFLKSAVSSLKSMRDGESSSHRKSKRKKRRLDHENSPSISASKDETVGPSSAERDLQRRASVPTSDEDGKHSKKRRKGYPTEVSDAAQVGANVLLTEKAPDIVDAKTEIDHEEAYGHGKRSKKKHRVKEDGGSMKAGMQVKQENLVSDLENTSTEHMNSRKMRGNDEINADIVSPVTREPKREVCDEGEWVTERGRKKDRKHLSKEQVDLQRELQVEGGKKVEMRVKQEKQASDLANTSVEQMNSRKMREKHVMNTDSVSCVLREPKREVSSGEGVTEKRRKKDGKHSGKKEPDDLQRELYLAGEKAAKMHVKQEKPVSDLDNASAEQMYLTKMRGENVISTDIVSPVTRESKREVGNEWEGITENRRKKDRKHSSKEQVEDLQRNLQMEGGKSEFELKGTLGTWKKPRKPGFPNGVVLSGSGEETPIDTDLGFPMKVKHWKPSEEENNLVVFSSKKAEKGGVFTDRLEEGTNSHHSKGKRKERAGDIEVDEMEQHSKKKRSRSQT